MQLILHVCTCTFTYQWSPPQVTTHGDLVHDMDSLHKKPYEMIIIGQYVGQASNTLGLSAQLVSSPAQDSNKGTALNMPHTKPLKKATDCNAGEIYSLTQPYCFLCVASQTHSQKPYLGGTIDTEYYYNIITMIAI